MCWTYGQCYVFSMWVLGSNIVIGLYCAGHMVTGHSSDRSVLTGHVVSAVCSLCGCWDLI